MGDRDMARNLIYEFKGDAYRFGNGALGGMGARVAPLGRRVALIQGRSDASRQVASRVADDLTAAGLDVIGRIEGARPNAPRQDVTRMAADLGALAPEVVVAVGGGSALDAAKAAIVLCVLGGAVDDYLGVGRVSAALEEMGQSLIPLVAVQMASSSAAHLTKYSNITDLSTGQKKLIVDEAIVPPMAFFDYAVTTSMGSGFTADGAFDGLAHNLEVLYGQAGEDGYARVEQIAATGIGLIVDYVERAVADPRDLAAREALGLATDLGGYAIMVGGTNGAHLTSFSLVDVLSHGRACAIMNPYYTVFFAPAIEGPLRTVGAIYRRAGFAMPDLDRLSGRELGLAVAEAMIALSKGVGFPTTLAEVDGLGPEHIERALTAAKDPALRSKLDNMPVPLTAETVDEYMGPVLAAARGGDLDLIRNVEA